MEYLRCSCPFCKQSLEYPSDAGSQIVPCPTCANEMTLPQAQAPPAGDGFFAGLLRKFQESRQAALDRKELKRLCMDAVADGVLTEEEEMACSDFMLVNGVTKAEMVGWRKEAFDRALRSVEDRGFTHARLNGLRRIQAFFCIPSGEISAGLARIERWSLLDSIRQHGPAPIEVYNVILARGERAFWSEPGTAYEEKVVSRRYEGGSRGVSIRVVKGVSFRLGAHRGRMVSETADVAVSTGNLVITDRRLIFTGDGKSFDSKFETLIDLCTSRNGIKYSERNRQKPRKVLFASDNGDIVMEVLSWVMGR